MKAGTRIARLWLMLTAGMLAISNTMASNQQNGFMLLMPARHAIVKYAFDIAALRPTTIVAYGGRTEDGDLLLHYWSTSDKRWVLLSLDDLAFGHYLPGPVQTLVVLGSSKSMPATIRDQAPPAENTISQEELDLAKLTNLLNLDMAFSAQEWKILAQRHGLKTRDLNAERRRYGRYGPPGKKAKRPQKKEEEPLTQDDVDVDVVQPMETDAVEYIEEKGLPIQQPQPPPSTETEPEPIPLTEAEPEPKPEEQTEAEAIPAPEPEPEVPAAVEMVKPVEEVSAVEELAPAVETPPVAPAPIPEPADGEAVMETLATEADAGEYHDKSPHPESSRFSPVALPQEPPVMDDEESPEDK